ANADAASRTAAEQASRAQALIDLVSRALTSLRVPHRWVGTRLDLLGPTGYVPGPDLVGPIGAQGNAGWTPQFGVATDGGRRVLQVSGWTGGQGTPPASGLYVGVGGLVPNIANAVDIRGPAPDTTGFIAQDGSRAFTGQQSFVAPAAGRASIVLPTGTDPSAATEGAIWNNGGTLKGYLGGVTRIFAFLGIAQSWGALQTFLSGTVLTPVGADPSSPVEGQRWHRSGLGAFLYLNSATRRLLDSTQFSTTAQAQDGTDTTTVMNPARVKESVTQFSTSDAPANDLMWFGDGSDGDLTASSGTTTLTRDTFYNNVTLSGSAIIDTAGHRLFVKGTLNISGLTSGYIGRLAAAATTQTGASALASGSLGGGVAGATGAPGSPATNT
ncbi:hypothetical protein ACFPYM_07970, partial [Methylobacterium hispanicum]